MLFGIGQVRIASILLLFTLIPSSVMASPKKTTSLVKKGTLLQITEWFLVIEDHHDLIQGIKMLSFGLVVNKNVIEVDHNEFANIRPKYFIHKSHKGTWSIGESKWQNQPFEQAAFGLKSCFSFTPLDANLVVRPSYINLEKHF